MGLALVTTFAFCAWIVMWAVGVSGFDGLLLVTLVILIAAGLRALTQYLPGAGDRVSEPGGW
jgi:hypothetical protein